MSSSPETSRNESRKRNKATLIIFRLFGYLSMKDDDHKTLTIVMPYRAIPGTGIGNDPIVTYPPLRMLGIFFIVAISM